ncbi:MAG: hypothetical protein H0X63_07320 [Flavobacteriales bacterium]|nr:hypothetical protein [Flavobacteriales bacterium]
MIAIVVAMTIFGLNKKTFKFTATNYEIIGHSIDTVRVNLTSHKFSLFITTVDIDEKIRIARQLESTNGRISNSILFFDKKESALKYSKTWKITYELTVDLKASYFSNNKFHKETFCYGNDTLTVNEYGIVSGWTKCTSVSELGKKKDLNK